MKKYLLFALMLSALIAGAQTSISNGSCKAYFKYAVNDVLMSPVASTPINFFDKSEGKATYWWWDFGDGTTSTEQNPFHIFYHPVGGPTVKMSPYRTVSLTVLTTDTCKSFYSEMINIMDGTTYSVPTCKAFFKYYQTAYDSLLGTASFQLDNYSEGDSLSYFWQFDNGKTSTERQPIVTFDIKPAEHQAILTVTGTNNCSDTFYETLTFYDPNAPLPEPVECSTAFGWNVNYDIKTFAPALTLDFYSKENPEAVKWSWDFGDGTTSDEPNPTHGFNYPLVKDSILGDPNSFRTVCLTVTTNTGCVSSTCQTIDIYQPITPPYEPDSSKCYTAFGYYPNYTVKTFAPALVLDFYPKIWPEATKWSWDFGDGTTSDAPNPTHIFDLPLSNTDQSVDQIPSRKVCLTATTSTGCVQTYCESIDLYQKNTPPDDPAPSCHAWFKYYPPSDIVSIPELIPYQFIDASEGNVVSRLWQFEDGSTRTEAAPIVSFDFMKPTQKVSLTIFTDDSCSSTWSEVIYVSGNAVDTAYVSKPVEYYHMRVTGYFPIQMSSCAGTAHAQVYLNDSVISADKYSWSTGEQGQDVKGLCPTKTYRVSAITADGIEVSSTFIFNSDGTVVEIPTNWYPTGERDYQHIKFDLDSLNLFVEWHLCDGTIVISDSIPLDLINCGGTDANMIMKDAAGNVVYTENISLKTLATGGKPIKQQVSSVQIYPNPVKDVLNITYSGNRLSEMQIEICDMAGRSLSNQKVFGIESGHNISMNVNSLRNGVYLCKMMSGKQLIGLKKFVK